MKKISQTAIGGMLLSVFYEYTHRRIDVNNLNLQLQKLIVEYKNDIFTNNDVNITIKNILGIKRSLYLLNIKESLFF